MPHNRILVAACCVAAVMLTSQSASAASVADLEVGLTSPPVPLVDAMAHYVVNVRNRGNRNADGVSLTVQLPTTHTSPSVFVMGDLSGVDPRCTRSGTRLLCNLGRVNRGATTTVGFDLGLPYSSATLVISAAASTTTVENVTSNNTAQLTAALRFYANPVAAPLHVELTSCTGTNLTSFFECTVYSGATQSHEFLLDTDGSIKLWGTTDVLGQWSQTSADQLQIQFSELGSPTATFQGRGVDQGCFEGVTQFSSTTSYVAPYRICPL